MPYRNNLRTIPSKMPLFCEDLKWKSKLDISFVVFDRMKLRQRFQEPNGQSSVKVARVKNSVVFFKILTRQGK